MLLYNFTTRLFLFCAVVTICGCQHRQQGIITTIDGISSEHSYEGLMMRPAQFRIVNLSGLMPVPEVGLLTFHSPDRGPSTAIGISRDREKSYQLHQTVPFCDNDVDKLIIIRDKLNELNQIAGRLVDARYQRFIFRNRKMAEEEGGSSHAIAMGDEITCLQRRFDDKYSELTTAISDSGIIIFRWTSRSSLDDSGRVGGLLKGDRYREEKQSGYAIVAGLRQSTLFVGEDIREAFPHIRRSNTMDRWNNKYRILTTQILQAKHIVWLSDAGWESIANIEVKFDPKNTSDLLNQIDQIEIARMQAQMQSLSNMAVISGMKREMKPVDWSAWDHAKNNQGWHTLLSVSARFSDIGYILNREFGKEMRGR